MPPAMTPSVRHAANILAGFLVVLALGLGATGGWFYLRAALFDRQGVPVTAVVVELSENRRGTPGTTTFRVSYHVTIRYQPPAVDQPQEETREVSRAFHNRLAPGDPVEVRVLPGRPGAVQIEPGSHRYWGFVLALTGGLQALVALLILAAVRLWPGRSAAGG